MQQSFIPSTNQVKKNRGQWEADNKQRRQRKTYCWTLEWIIQKERTVASRGHGRLTPKYRNTLLLVFMCVCVCVKGKMKALPCVKKNRNQIQLKCASERIFNQIEEKEKKKKTGSPPWTIDHLSVFLTSASGPLIAKARAAIRSVSVASGSRCISEPQHCFWEQWLTGIYLHMQLHMQLHMAHTRTQEWVPLFVAFGHQSFEIGKNKIHTPKEGVMRW